MSGVLERSIRILEVLARNPSGLPVSHMAQELDVPISAAHRLLSELGRLGYVRQVRAHGPYALTLKLPGLGLSMLDRCGHATIVQPILARLGLAVDDLALLGVADGADLVYVAAATGCPDAAHASRSFAKGEPVHPASSAGGLAWLSTLSDEAALARITESGLRPPGEEPAPTALRSTAEVFDRLRLARRTGYAYVVDPSPGGVASMAAPIRFGGDGSFVGCVTLSAPASRFTLAQMAARAEGLIDAAHALGLAAPKLPLLARAAGAPALDDDPEAAPTDRRLTLAGTHL